MSNIAVSTDTATPPLIKRVLMKYGQDFTTVAPVQKGYRNESYAAGLKNGETINLILYKREEGIVRRIKNANRVSEYLTEHKLPIRFSIDSRILQLKSESTGAMRYASLYNYLPGHTIAWEAYTKAHLKVIGLGMAKLHQTLVDVPQRDLPAVDTEHVELLQRMEAYFGQSGVQDAMQDKLSLKLSGDFVFYSNLVKATGSLRNQQPLHMDYVRGNLLFINASSNDPPTSIAVDRVQLSGILDFEKTAYGHVVYDIARTLAFLLVDCKYKSPQAVRKYFLYSGYVVRGHGVLPEMTLKVQNTTYRILDELITLFLLHDFYKFLLHNPYEHLAQNEHYVRTRDLLIERQVFTVI